MVERGSSQSHFSALTEFSERLRLDNPQASHEPLHHRRIVNIIVKSKMKRRWGLEDVYLFVYHPKWKAYHLIGLGQKRPEETDDKLIAKDNGYPIGYTDSTRTTKLIRTSIRSDLRLTALSRTNGAFTEYTYRIVYASKIAPELRLNELTEKGKEGQGPFRWFTLREIEGKKGDQGEEIIFSTPVIMQHIREDKAPVKKRLPLTEANVDDVRPRDQSVAGNGETNDGAPVYLVLRCSDRHNCSEPSAAAPSHSVQYLTSLAWSRRESSDDSELDSHDLHFRHRCAQERARVAHS